MQIMVTVKNLENANADSVGQVCVTSLPSSPALFLYIYFMFTGAEDLN